MKLERQSGMSDLTQDQASKNGAEIANGDYAGSHPEKKKLRESRTLPANYNDTRRIKSAGHVSRESSDANLRKAILQRGKLSDSLSALDDIVTEKSRRLVLHFDIRNTILVADSIANVNVEQSLNSFLTGVAWGKEVEGKWIWATDQPSLTQPSEDSITYYKFMENKLVTKPSDRLTLRKITGDFTSEELGKQFNSYFKKHLELLRWKHESCDNKLVIKGQDEDTHYHYLLPSFIKLLSYLQSQDRDFTLIIRTYGLDASNVLRSLEHIVNGNHPEFPEMKPMDIRLTPGKITRLQNEFKCEVIKNPEFVGHPPARRNSQVRRSSSVTVATSDTYTSEDKIYQMFNSVRGICGFVDDFKFWQDEGYNHKAGKPLWIDLQDPTLHHIFFDDNIRVTDDDSIVDVRLRNSVHTDGNDEDISWHVLSRPELIQLEDVCLVQADLLRSTEDLNYFVNKLLECEKNYDQLLKDGIKL